MSPIDLKAPPPRGPCSACGETLCALQHIKSRMGRYPKGSGFCTECYAELVRDELPPASQKGTKDHHVPWQRHGEGKTNS